MTASPTSMVPDPPARAGSNLWQTYTPNNSEPRPDAKTGALQGVRLTRTIFAIPGRIRFHLCSLRYNQAGAREMELLLSAHAGIQTVRASALTGTVLVEFDPTLPDSAVVTLIEDALAGRLPAALAATPVQEKLQQDGGSLRRWLHGLLRTTQPQLNSGLASLPSDLVRDRAWHALSVDEALNELRVSPKGLSATEAQSRLTLSGLNVLPIPDSKPAWLLIWNQVRSLPVLLLIGSAALSIMTGSVVDGIVIAVVVVLNTTIGFATEARAERTIATLTRLEEPETLVMRDGRVLLINAADITVGDVIALTRGAAIAADARILKARNLTLAESALTGESAPINKGTEPQPSATPLAERRNMVYRGTVVTGGSGLALVTAVGGRTEIGRVHSLINQASRPQTPMEIQLNRLGRQTAVAAVAVFGLTLILGYLRGFSAVEILRSAVSLAVAALPEGLPSMATAALAFGMLRMRRQNVLARSLAAVETVGAVDLLCLDKTGTLTMNRMTAVEVYAGGRQVPVGMRQSLLSGTRPEDAPHLNMLLAVCALCSEAEVSGSTGSAKFEGSATEVALLDLVEASHLDVSELRRRFPLLELEARAENRNFMITVHGGIEEAVKDRSMALKQGSGYGLSSRRLVAMKGSPAEVLSRCQRSARASGVRSLRDAERKRVLKENNRLASQGRRVLGVAYAEIHAGEEASNFVWLGLVALADPAREGAHEAIRALHRAGIATRMVTGDQGATAYAIAREIGLFEDGNGAQQGDYQQPQVWDASASPDDSPRAEQIERSRIFSRVSPSHKLEIVQALQRFGHVVAMTGDGINDGPALKAADVGIALGGQSTDTARESADLILRTDDLRSLLGAVREGRAVHHNLRQAVRFLIATNLSEVLSVLGAVGLGFGQPLTARQLLWLNLVTDIFPVLALAVEPPHPGILETPPPDPKQPLISRDDLPLLVGESALLAGAVGSSYLYALRRYGMGAEATTMAFFSLTTAQLLHTLVTRSGKSGANGSGEGVGLLQSNYVPLAVCGSFMLQLVTMFTPLRSLLGLAPLVLTDYAVCAASVGLSSAATYLLRSFQDDPQDGFETDMLPVTSRYSNLMGAVALV